MIDRDVGGAGDTDHEPPERSHEPVRRREQRAGEQVDTRTTAG